MHKIVCENLIFIHLSKKYIQLSNSMWKKSDAGQVRVEAWRADFSSHFLLSTMAAILHGIEIRILI